MEIVSKINKKLKLVLMQPGSDRFVDDKVEAAYGLLMIAASVREHHPDVEIIFHDLSGGIGIESIPEADIYGMGVYSCSLDSTRKIKEHCRQLNPKCVIVIGGPHPTYVEEPGIGIQVKGDGEWAMCDIIQDVKDDKELRPSYYHEVDDINKLPMAAYDLITDISSYSRAVGGHKCASVFTSRGCPYKCTFCTLTSKTVRYYEPEKFIEEIRMVKKLFGIRYFNILDDTFTIPSPRLYKMLELLQKEEVQFRFHGRVIRRTQKDLLKRIKEVGGNTIAFGFECGSERMLKVMRKNVTPEDNYRHGVECGELGYTVRGFFICNHPGERYEEALQTPELIKKMYNNGGLHQFFISQAQPFPGSAIFERPEEFGISWINPNFEDYVTVDSTGKGPINFRHKEISYEEMLRIRNTLQDWVLTRFQSKFPPSYTLKLQRDNLGINHHRLVGFLEKYADFDINNKSFVVMHNNHEFLNKVKTMMNDSGTVDNNKLIINDDSSIKYTVIPMLDELLQTNEKQSKFKTFAGEIGIKVSDNFKDLSENQDYQVGQSW